MSKAVHFEDPREALLYVGIDPVGLNRIDRHISRLPTLNKPRKTNGYVIKNPDGSFTCADWSNPELKAYFSNSERIRLSKSEYATRQRLYKLQQVQSERKRERTQQEKAVLAYAIWRRSVPLVRPHPYLQRKQVQPVNTIREVTPALLRDLIGYSPFNGRILVFPLRYGDQPITSLQFISEDGEKRFLKDARIDGCYWQSRKDESPAYIGISEGIATTLSVVQHSQINMLGVSAMSAGNIAKVAKHFRGKYPEAYITLYGDNDARGLECVSEALKALGGNVGALFPEFTDEYVAIFQQLTQSNKAPSDWQDYYLVTDYIDKKRIEKEGFV